MNEKNRVEVPLWNGLKIVAEAGNYSDFQMYIGIVDKDGSWVQDLAIVMKNWRNKPVMETKEMLMDYTDNLFKILVFTDSESDDYTEEHLIRLRDDIEL